MPRASHTPADQYVSLQVGADAYGCSVDTLRRRVRDGALPAVRSGRIIRVRIADLESLFRPVGSLRQAG